MLKLIAIAVGVLSYIAALLFYLLDNLLFFFHFILRGGAEQFLKDGDTLTGWGVRVE
jgi:hypothetical protein